MNLIYDIVVRIYGTFQLVVENYIIELLQSGLIFCAIHEK